MPRIFVFLFGVALFRALLLFLCRRFWIGVMDVFWGVLGVNYCQNCKRLS